MRELSSIAMMLMVGGVIAGGSAKADSITTAKAAELSLHRVERLVVLKKIEESYQSRFVGLAVTPVVHQTDTDPAFEALLREGPGADGTFKSLKIVMDATGKAIQHTVIAGAAPNDPVTWPNADPVTLSENALHQILDNFTTDPRLQPYYAGLTTLSISPGTDGAGASVAIVEIHAAPAAPILKIAVKLDGTFESYQIVPGGQASLSTDKHAAADEPLQPTFTSIRQRIFEPRCFSCHSEGGHASRVPLQTLQDLLNSPRDLVLPGNPDDSGLVIAVSRDDKKRMPPPSSGEPALTGQEIAVIRQWITNGAPE